MTKYHQYRITFSSNPEYTPVIVQDKTFSVPSDITSIDDVNEYLHELTGIFIINNWGKVITCEKCHTEIPSKYIKGVAKDDMYIECYHQGWFCPKHSPTNNCDVDFCPCCNA